MAVDRKCAFGAIIYNNHGNFSDFNRTTFSISKKYYRGIRNNTPPLRDPGAYFLKNRGPRRSAGAYFLKISDPREVIFRKNFLPRFARDFRKFQIRGKLFLENSGPQI